MRLMGRKHKTKNTPAQQDSGNSKLSRIAMGIMGIMRGMRLMGRKHKTKNSPAQRDSKMSNERLSGVVCRQHRQKGMFTMQVKNIMSCFIGLRGDESMSKMQNTLPQRDSKMSNLKKETENSLPQRHSIMSNGRLSGVLCWPHGQKAMSTMRIKNMVGRFMGVMRIMRNNGTKT